MSNQQLIRERITNQIIEALRKGTAPWRRPWTDLQNGGLPRNVASGRLYSGVNPLLLQLVALERTYHSQWWGTFRQWSDLGARIKKRPDDVPPGEFGTRIVFFRPIEKITKNEKGEEKKSRFGLMREFTVFNVEQVEGACVDHLRAKPRASSAFVDFEPADRVIAATGADIRYGGTQAYYARKADYIQIPVKEAFSSPNDWYSTHFHELCHWSEKRLEWTASYAMNELVAEIGSCYLSSEIGIPQSDDLRNHESYLSSWLREFEDDPTALFRAATQASKATDYLLSLSRSHEDDSADEETTVEETVASN